MSASPDYMTALLSGTNGLMNSSLYSPLMGLAAGLLQAGGPSRMPTSLGQALGAALQGAQQFQQGGIQNAMQQLQLRQALQGQQYFQGLLSGGQPTDSSPQTPASQIPQGTPPTSPSQAAPQAAPAIDSSLAGAPDNPLLRPLTPAVAAPQAKPAPVSLPQVMDPSADATYQALMRQAQLAEYFKVGSGKPFEDKAQARLQELQNQVVTLNPQQAALIIPGGLPAGQSLQFHPYSGKAETIGTDAIGQLNTFSPSTGTFLPTLVDKRTGKPIGGTSSTAAFDPSQPLPGTLESQAQAVANYEQQAPTISSRNPSASLVLARARAINPDYDQTQYAAKSKAASAFTTGQQGQQIAAFNTAISHLQTLETILQNLGNTNTPAFNHLANFYKAQTGQAAPTNFATAKQLVAGEIAKAIAGGNMTEGDRDKANSVLSAANSPAQLQGAIDTIKQLMGGKLVALKTQYESAGLKNFERKLEPASQRALTDFEGSEQPSSGWSIQKVP